MTQKTQTFAAKEEGSVNSEQYKALLDRLRDGVFIISQGRIVLKNRSALSILGLTPENFNLQEVFDCLIHTENATARGSLQRLLTGKPFGPIQYEVKIPDSGFKTLEVLCHEISFRGSPALQVLISDHTREYAVETELFDTLTLFNSFFDAIEEAIFILDDPGLTLRSSNISTGRIFKIDRAGLKGSKLWQLLADPSHAEEMIKQIKEKLPQRGTLHFDFDMRRGDGVVFPALQTITEVTDTRGQKIGLMWIVSDMTQQAYLNRALAEVETRYRVLFDRAGDPTLIVDTESHEIIDANKAAEDQLGYNRAELIGKNVFELTPEARHTSMINDFKSLLNSGSASMQGTNLAKDGSEVPVEINAVVTSFGDRKVFIIACRDITQQLEMQKEMLRIEKLEAVRQVAGGIAHEFSQPLQGLITIAEILNHPSTDVDKYRDLISKIPPLVDRMNILLSQMKGIVRLAIKPYVKRDGIVDLNRSIHVQRMLIVDPTGEFEKIATTVATVRGVDSDVARNIDDAVKNLENIEFDLLICNPQSTGKQMSEFVSTVRTRWPRIGIVEIHNEPEKPSIPTEWELINIMDRALGMRQSY